MQLWTEGQPGLWVPAHSSDFSHSTPQWPLPLSNPHLFMSLTYRRCGSGKARRCWGYVPSEAEQRGTPSGWSGLPHTPVHWHAPQPLPTHKVHTVFSQPMETFEEEKERKECHEARAEVIPKNSEGQASLSDSVPGPFQKVLWGEQGMIWNPVIVWLALDPVLWGHQHITSISAALSCPKNTLPITLPRRKTSTKAWMYRTWG